MTCHNIEVFQATKEDADAFNSSEAVQLFGTSTAKHVVSGQVGFRCVHCFAGEDMGPVATVHSGPSVVYPASVGTISTALRHMRDHFDSCEAMSQASKNAFADARREQEEQDAGLGRSSCQKKGGGKNGPDERRRIAFLDFCVDFCQRKDIVNIQPQRSGLKYRLPMAATSSVAVGDAATGISTAGMPRREGLVPTTNLMGAKQEDKSLTPTSIPATIAAIPQNVGNSSTFVPNFPFFSDGYGAWICRCEFFFFQDWFHLLDEVIFCLILYSKRLIFLNVLCSLLFPSSVQSAARSLTHIVGQEVSGTRRIKPLPRESLLIST